MLAKMFPTNGEKIPEIRFKGFEGEWECRKLGEVSVIKTGISNREDSDLFGEYTFLIDRKMFEKVIHIYMIAKRLLWLEKAQNFFLNIL